MPVYQYTTRDTAGRPVHGTLEAADARQALAALAAQGLTITPENMVEISQTAEQSPPVRLSPSEAVDAAEVLADLTTAELPLASGLRAMAEELPRRRVRRYLLYVADQIDRGVSLEQALEYEGHGVPGFVRGAVSGGVRAGRLAEVLEQLVVIERERAEMRRRIVASLAYPAILFAFLLGLTVFLNTFVVQPMNDIYEDFDTELPVITEALISASDWWSTDGVGLGVLMLLLGAICIVSLWVFRGTAGVQQVFASVPVLGPAWRWQGLAEFARMMSVLLDRGIPMPAALRLTADGVRQHDLARACRASAKSVENGKNFAECMDRYRAFPPSLKPLVTSGIETAQPAEGFRAAAEMYSRRTAVDLTLWDVIVPPVLLVVVATSVGLLMVALMMPLISITTQLSFLC